MLQQCNVVNYARVELYTSRNSDLRVTMARNYQISVFHLGNSFFTVNIPPIWRSGFMLSLVAPLRLVYYIYACRSDVED